MKITLAQLNPTVGDIDGNVARIEETLHQCRGESPDLVVFPELFLVGYPPRDLLERRWFIERAERGVQDVREISTRYPGTGVLFGAPQRTQQETGRGLFNSALLVRDGEVLCTQHKSLLPMSSTRSAILTRHLRWAWFVSGIRHWVSPSARMPGTIRSSGREGFIHLIRRRPSLGWVRTSW